MVRRYASKVPSRRPPSSTCCTWARPWPSATMLSDRVSSQRSGRASSRASHATRSSSGEPPSLAPKPPPTSGTITRTVASSSPSREVSAPFTPWAFWLLDQHVQRLVVAEDPLGCVLTLVPLLRDDGYDRLTRETHDAVGEERPCHRLVEHGDGRRHRGEVDVGRGEHADDAGRGTRVVDV